MLSFCSHLLYYDKNANIEELKVLNIKKFNIEGKEEGNDKFKRKLSNIFTQWQNKFDIEKGPIYSIGYIYGYSDGSARLYFALHHLIVDGVSWRILVRD